jgi:hypothetical protein
VTTGPLPAASGGGEGVACLFSWGGAVVHATAFDLLWLAPGALSVDAVAELRGNATLAGWPASPTPSASPTVSATMTRAVPGRVTWVDATAPDGRAVSVRAAPSHYVRAGVEGDGNDIFVCRGVLPTGESVAGKYEAAWSFCDVP